MALGAASTEDRRNSGRRDGPRQDHPDHRISGRPQLQPQGQEKDGQVQERSDVTHRLSNNR